MVDCRTFISFSVARGNFHIFPGQRGTVGGMLAIKRQGRQKREFKLGFRGLGCRLRIGAALEARGGGQAWERMNVNGFRAGVGAFNSNASVVRMT